MEEIMSLKFTSDIWVFLLSLILMAIDIITGYYGAWKNNEISSQKMRDGIGKKIAELCYITIGYLFKLAFGLSAVMYFIGLYIIYMELTSIAENCKKLGIEIPLLNDKLNNMKKGDK